MITPVSPRPFAETVMKSQKRAERRTTGPSSITGPTLTGSRAVGETRPQQIRPRIVSLKDMYTETAWNPIAAKATATPVIHSEPRVPNVDAPTRLRREPAAWPASPGTR